MEITKVVEKKSSLIKEAAAQVRTAVVGQQREREIEPDSLVTLVNDHQVVRMINEGELAKLKTITFTSTGTDYHGRPFLFCAIATGEREVVEYLVKKGADINSKYLSQNVLHYAAALGHHDIVYFFLLRGLKEKIEERDARDNTPLLLAIKSGAAKVVEVLLEAGANVKQIDDEGNDAFYYALKNRELKIIDVLMSLEKNSDWEGLIRRSILGWIEPNERDTDYDKSLFFKAVREGCVGLMTYLFQTRSYDVNSRVSGDGGESILHLACENGRKEVVELLLAKGAVIKAVDRDGWTPLHSAAWAGHTEVVEFLLAQGADVKVVTSGGWTLLHLACLKGHKDVIELLLAQGADLKAVSSDGSTPLHSAAWAGHTEVVEFLLAKGAHLKAGNKKWFFY